MSIRFLHIRFAGRGWLWGVLLPLCLCAPLDGLADEASDIARLLELSDQYKQAITDMRQGKITGKQMREQVKVIQKEQRKINNAYGRIGSKDRRAWDRKVKQAKKEHRKQQWQAEQAAKEKQRAAKTEAQAAEKPEAPQPDKDYSQVHLPEEVAKPMKTTDVQGIHYGMTKAEVEAVLKEQGYQPVGRQWHLDDGQSVRRIQPSYGHLFLADNDKTPKLFFVHYTQRFRPEIKFDTESITKALADKYGEPSNDWQHPVKGVGLSYQPEQPSYNVQAACSEEMQRRGTTPNAMGEIHPMQYKAWQERGERDVKQRCPDQLNGFRKFMHFKLGIWGSATANAQTKEITIEWKDNGQQQRKWRLMKEEQFLKQDSGPAAAPAL